MSKDTVRGEGEWVKKKGKTEKVTKTVRAGKVLGLPVVYRVHNNMEPSSRRGAGAEGNKGERMNADGYLKQR